MTHEILPLSLRGRKKKRQCSKSNKRLLYSTWKLFQGVYIAYINCLKKKKKIELDVTLCNRVVYYSEDSLHK